VGRLDEMAAAASETSVSPEPSVASSPVDAETSKEVHPARLGLQSITIADLMGFLFKLVIAGIVVAFPFAVVFLIIALATGYIR
jgi:hypothetical protein